MHKVLTELPESFSLCYQVHKHIAVHNKMRRLNYNTAKLKKIKLPFIIPYNILIITISAALLLIYCPLHSFHR